MELISDWGGVAIGARWFPVMGGVCGVGRVSPGEDRALCSGCPAPTVALRSFYGAGEHELRPFTHHPWDGGCRICFSSPLCLQEQSQGLGRSGPCVSDNLGTCVPWGFPVRAVGAAAGRRGITGITGDLGWMSAHPCFSTRITGEQSCVLGSQYSIISRQ